MPPYGLPRAAPAWGQRDRQRMRSPFGPGVTILGSGAVLLISFLFFGVLLPGTWSAEDVEKHVVLSDFNANFNNFADPHPSLDPAAHHPLSCPNYS